jgi:hypothetical protein
MRYWWESQNVRDHWEDIIKIDLKEIGWDGKNWIDLAKDTDQWMTLVKTVMKFRVHKLLGISLVAAQMAAFKEGISSMSE